MGEEQTIQAALTTRFPALQDKIRVQRERRIFVDVPYADFAAVFDYIVKDMQFPILCAMTGLDQGESLGVIYHLARESGVVLNVATSVPKDKPVLQTVTSYFPAADVYEREMVDLLGMQVTGLPEGPRYPLPNDWPAGEYPLRKDWKPSNSGASQM